MGLMMGKIVYQTDQYGHYMGATQADESPLEPGVYLIPKGAVEVSPPLSWPVKHWPRWNGSTWEIIRQPTVVERVVNSIRALFTS